MEAVAGISLVVVVVGMIICAKGWANNPGVFSGRRKSNTQYDR